MVTTAISPRSVSRQSDTAQTLQRVDTAATRDSFQRLQPNLTYASLLETPLADANVRDLRAEKLQRKHDQGGTCRQMVSLAENRAPEAPSATCFTSDAWRAKWPSKDAESLRAQLRACAGSHPSAPVFESLLLGFKKGPASPPHAHGAALALQLHGSKQWQVWPSERHAPIELRLSAGEALYVPAGWQHATVNETTFTATLSIVLDDETA